jgi:hypothetical protein
MRSAAVGGTESGTLMGDAELARVILAWSKLPKHARTTIAGIVQSWLNNDTAFGEEANDCAPYR